MTQNFKAGEPAFSSFFNEVCQKQRRFDLVNKSSRGEKKDKSHKERGKLKKEKERKRKAHEDLQFKETRKTLKRPI